MVVTPEYIQDLLKKREEQTEREQIDAIERSIDHILEDGRTNVPLALFPSLNVRDMIISKYVAAGWNVSRVRILDSDGFYQFKPASSKD